MNLESILKNNEYEKAIWYLQVQKNMAVHAGGITSLILQGRNHHLELNPNRIILFGINQKNTELVLNHDWGFKTNYYQSNFLPTKMGLRWFNQKGTILAK